MHVYYTFSMTIHTASVGLFRIKYSTIRCAERNSRLTTQTLCLKITLFHAHTVCDRKAHNEAVADTVIWCALRELIVLNSSLLTDNNRWPTAVELYYSVCHKRTTPRCTVRSEVYRRLLAGRRCRIFVKTRTHNSPAIQYLGVPTRLKGLLSVTVARQRVSVTFVYGRPFVHPPIVQLF